MINNKSNNKFKCIKYTWEHKKAFLRIEKQLTGKNTIRGYLHDLDKIFLYLIFDRKTTHKIHVKHARHHIESNKEYNKKDYIQMIVDWECARYTKPDKPLNAYETLCKYYPQLKSKLIGIMRELGLIDL